jgi:hypothetical protein
MAKDLDPKDREFLDSVFDKALPEEVRLRMNQGCPCEGCSCPPGGGYICDGGQLCGQAAGRLGASTA